MEGRGSDPWPVDRSTHSATSQDQESQAGSGPARTRLIANSAVAYRTRVRCGLAEEAYEVDIGRFRGEGV